MSPDHDEAELYPPDVEVVTSDAANQRNRAVIGVSLVTIGCGLMLERIIDNQLDYFWLALGFGLLAGWAKVPRFPMFAAGAILTGFGLGDLVKSFLGVGFELTIGLLFGAAGFLAVYVRYPKKARWALFPAAIFGCLAFAALGVELIGLIPGAVTGMLLPLVVIGAGVLLVFRNRLPRKFVSCGVVAALFVFVSSAASSIGDSHRDGIRTVTIVTRPPSTSVGPGGDGPLTVVTDSGDVDIRVDPDATEATVTASDDDRDRGFGLFGRDRGAGMRSGSRSVGPDDDLVVVVPPGTPMSITSDGGSITGEYGGGAVTITTKDGDVDLELLTFSGAAETADRVDLSIVTTSGDVDIDAEGAPGASIEATTSESIDVDGDDMPSPFIRERSGYHVTIMSHSGEIDIDDLVAA